jgi:hypothetical protein
MEVYIDDVVVKLVGFKEHMIDLKLLLERMKKYGLWMNPLKCVFGVTSGRFLGFIVHEHGIQIDPKKIESIRKIREPVCRKDVQKLLSKINYLRRFISNLAGRVESLLPLVQLKHEEDFTWGQNNEELLRRSKNTSCLHPYCEHQRPGPIQDVYCCARTGYWSCSTRRRRWQGVFGSIHKSTSTCC